MHQFWPLLCRSRFHTFCRRATICRPSQPCPPQRPYRTMERRTPDLVRSRRANPDTRRLRMHADPRPLPAALAKPLAPRCGRGKELPDPHGVNGEGGDGPPDVSCPCRVEHRSDRLAPCVTRLPPRGSSHVRSARPRLACDLLSGSGPPLGPPKQDPRQR